MRVKRFTGDNVADTMSKIKRELGPEAVILQTRQIKEGGFLGFFGRNLIEITAAVEDRPQKINTEAIKKAYEAYRDKENLSIKQMPAQNETVSENSGQDLFRATQSEIKQMHTILKEIKGRLSRDKESEIILPEPLEKWGCFLNERGLSLDLTYHLIGKIKTELSEEEWDNSKLVLERIKMRAAELCQHTDTIKPRKSRSTVVALIGPTGVGKTTTIGKLAAGFSIIERRRVALITADTYRVAAVEQLKIFGEIIGVPVEVVMTPENLKDAIDGHRDKELIFIDTAGRSPHHDLHMTELEAFLEIAKPDITMLVISVTTNLADQLKVLERFKPLSTHLILTKLDESSRPASVLDLLVKSDLPIAYLTNGQNVPDDIDAATPEKIAECILGEENIYV